MADRLVAWLYDTPVAVLTRGPEFRIRLEWRPEGIERWRLGSPALSVGLPIGAPTGPRDMRGMDFFENMLPEGAALERMATLAGVRPVDTYGILAAFGRDCAGAIMVLPDGDRPGGNHGSGYSPMTPDDLRRVISALDVIPLAAAPERGFRPSLAGFQRKALLGRAGDGTWQLPSGDAPSTWILKPDGPHAMAANEAACLRLAAACGLPVPETELLDVAGLPVLAVKRYDRQDAPTGDIPVRVHQEDGCQATATPPGLKYEEQDGRTVVDRFVASRPDLDAADREMLLGWRDPVEGFFEILGQDGDAIVLLNLIDDLTYLTYANMGPASLRRLPKGGFVYVRLVPVSPVPG